MHRKRLPRNEIVERAGASNWPGARGLAGLERGGRLVALDRA